MEQHRLMLLCCLAKLPLPPAEHCLKPQVTKTSAHEWHPNWSSSPPPSLCCSTSLCSLHFPWQKDKGQAASPTQGCQSQASSCCPPSLQRSQGIPPLSERALRRRESGLEMEGWRLERRMWQRITKRQEWLRRIEKASGENSEEKKRKIVCQAERRELREREGRWIINEE